MKARRKRARARKQLAEWKLIRKQARAMWLRLVLMPNGLVEVSGLWSQMAPTYVHRDTIRAHTTRFVVGVDDIRCELELRLRQRRGH